MNSRPSSFTLTSPGRLRLYSTSELLRLPAPTWLIEKIIPSGGLIGLYGQPGTGKSFLAIDIAMSVATGQPWQGQDVRKGSVLYVSAEGGTGIGKRVAAWLLDRQISPSEANVAWLTEAIPVTSDSDDMEILLDRITNEAGYQPTLVIIDTLARCFDGDENQQEDMGRFIGGVDKLRREFDGAVIVVHHTRLDGERERGNTAFRGAADTMIYLKRDKTGDIEITCSKQKDDEEFAPRSFQLKVVPETESCVIVEPAVSRDAWILKQIQISGDGGIAFKELKAQASGSDISPTALKRRLVGLIQNGKIIRENGIYFPKT